MSPAGNGVSVEPGQTVVETHTVGLERVLQDGEIIILAVKPSSWFVLLVSLPALAFLALVGAGTYLADRLFGYEAIPLKLAALVLAFGAMLRIMVASFQWLGRLYVLTNRRVIHIRGIARIDLTQCPLADVQEVIVAVSTAERMVGLGSLYFRPPDEQAGPIAWMHLADPLDVQRTVEQAVNQAKRNAM